MQLCVQVWFFLMPASEEIFSAERRSSGCTCKNVDPSSQTTVDQLTEQKRDLWPSFITKKKKKTKSDTNLIGSTLLFILSLT